MAHRSNRYRYLPRPLARALACPTADDVDPTLDPETRVVRFVQAAGRDRTAQVQGWLNLGVSVQARDGAALVAAAQAGHAGMVERLLDVGADPWVRDGQALVLTARGGHDRAMDVLLDRMGTTTVLAMRSWPGSGISPEFARERWAQVLRQSVNEATGQAHRTVIERLVGAGADLTGLPMVEALMVAEAGRRRLNAQGSAAYGHGHLPSGRAQQLAGMNQASYQKHMDLVTWLLDPQRYGPDHDGRLLLRAAEAGNMLWFPAVLRLAPRTGWSVHHLEPALHAAEAAGFDPIVERLRPLMVLAQRQMLDAVVDDAIRGMATAAERGGTMDEPGGRASADRVDHRSSVQAGNGGPPPSRVRGRPRL